MLHTYALRRSVFNIHVTVKWRKIPNDPTRGASRSQQMFEAATVHTGRSALHSIVSNTAQYASIDCCEVARYPDTRSSIIQVGLHTRAHSGVPTWKIPSELNPISDRQCRQPSTSDSDSCTRRVHPLLDVFFIGVTHSTAPRCWRRKICLTAPVTTSNSPGRTVFRKLQHRAI